MIPSRFLNIKKAYLTADFSTTTTSVSQVTGFIVQVDAYKIYRMSASIQTSCDGTGGLQFRITTPAGVTFKSLGVLGSKASNSAVLQSPLSPNSTINSIYNNVVGTGFLTINGYVFTDVNAGDFYFQLKSVTGGQTSKFLTDSMFDLIEIGTMPRPFTP